MEEKGCIIQTSYRSLMQIVQVQGCLYLDTIARHMLQLLGFVHCKMNRTLVTSKRNSVENDEKHNLADSKT